MQITLEGRRELADRSQALTRDVRSCSDGSQLRRELPVKVAENRNISSKKLPPSVRVLIDDLPLGHATKVLSKGDLEFRVLVICERKILSGSTDPFQ